MRIERPNSQVSQVAPSCCPESGFTGCEVVVGTVVSLDKGVPNLE